MTFIFFFISNKINFNTVGKRDKKKFINNISSKNTNNLKSINLYLTNILYKFFKCRNFELFQLLVIEFVFSFQFISIRK